MKRSFTIMALTMAMVIMAGVAAADSVDIGLGRMDSAEFEVLRQMVAGQYEPTRSVTTAITRDASYVAEFDRRDVESIRQGMAQGSDAPVAVAAGTGGSQVDIGLGSMATNEFCDLNKLVASSTTGHKSGFTYICP